MTVYLNPTGTEMAQRSASDHCAWCDSEVTAQGCFCRYCDSCSRYWKDSERKDFNDGRPSVELCAECQQQCEQLETGSGASPPSTALVRYDPRFKFSWAYLADCAEQRMLNICRSIDRQLGATMREVRKASAALPSACSECYHEPHAAGRCSNCNCGETAISRSAAVNSDHELVVTYQDFKNTRVSTHGITRLRPRKPK
jgi:hypothetical protein